MLNIARTDKGETNIALEGTENGCHWTLLFFKRNSPVWYYGGSLGWPFPLNPLCLENILMQAEKKCSSRFIASRVQCLRLHHPSNTSKHHCNRNCKIFAVQMQSWYLIYCPDNKLDTSSASEQQRSCTDEPMHAFHHEGSAKDQGMQDVSDSDPGSVTVSKQQLSSGPKISIFLTLHIAAFRSSSRKCGKRSWACWCIACL